MYIVFSYKNIVMDIPMYEHIIILEREIEYKVHLYIEKKTEIMRKFLNKSDFSLVLLLVC